MFIVNYLQNDVSAVKGEVLYHTNHGAYTMFEFYYDAYGATLVAVSSMSESSKVCLLPPFAKSTHEEDKDAVEHFIKYIESVKGTIIYDCHNCNSYDCSECIVVIRG